MPQRLSDTHAFLLIILTLIATGFGGYYLDRNNRHEDTDNVSGS